MSFEDYKTTLILRAGVIPDGQEVRKPTGTAKYILKKEVGIYIHTGKEINIYAKEKEILEGKGKELKNIVIKNEGVFFLFCSNSGAINAIDRNLNLAIDFDHIKNAKEFLEDIMNGKE